MNHPNESITKITIDATNTSAYVYFEHNESPAVIVGRATPRDLAEQLVTMYPRDSEKYLDRWLLKATRTQNGEPARMEYSLADVISYPDQFPFSQHMRNEVFKLIAKGAHSQTRQALDRELKYPERLRNCGLFDRLQIFPSASYCAGQDYPAEIAELRNLIKNGGR